MNSVLDFLNQPIISTLVTLIVGSYLLNLIAERRSRKDMLKDQAITFINDVADHTNSFVVAIFEKLRTNRIVIDESLEDAIRELYSRRMSIEISSRAYLKSEDFYKQYFAIIDAFGDVMGVFMRVDRGDPVEEVLVRVKENYSQLEQEWPLAGELTTPASDDLLDHLILWMEMLSHRATDLLTKHLKMVMENRNST